MQNPIRITPTPPPTPNVFKDDSFKFALQTNYTLFQNMLQKEVILIEIWEKNNVIIIVQFVVSVFRLVGIPPLECLPFSIARHTPESNLTSLSLSKSH